MSSSEADEVCAACGKAEVDDIKLRRCTACKLVKYCSVDCQKNHRPKHKKECKKRAAELRDDKLFTKPDESHLGECPICCLPLSNDPDKSTMNSCCCKAICDGCGYANMKRELEEGLEPRCAFCREPVPKTKEEIAKNLMERAKANDPVAIYEMGKKHYNKGDYDGAFEYYTKAAGLGEVGAHYNLSFMYRGGEGVAKDMKKEIYHLEEAAIGGHPEARFNLGYYENENGRYERAMKHFIIAANQGDADSLDYVKKYFSVGLVSKEDYAAALRGHQAAVDATKSEQRDAADEFMKEKIRFS
jgi:tetratricopeptide (TPR) repeat protein